MITLQADLLEVKSPRTGRARGVVLEARKSAQHGVVVNVLVRSGTLGGCGIRHRPSPAGGTCA